MAIPIFMTVQEAWFLKDVEATRLNTNLFGETDTPIEIYNFYKKLETSKNYSLLTSEIGRDLANKGECASSCLEKILDGGLTWLK